MIRITIIFFQPISSAFVSGKMTWGMEGCRCNNEVWLRCVCLESTSDCSVQSLNV